MQAPVADNISADLFSDLQRETPSQATATVESPSTSFLKKCLHPPSAVPGFCGLPTNDARSQVLLQYRNLAINRTPYFWDHTTNMIVAATPATLPTFDYAILTLSGARVLSLGFIYDPALGSLQQDYNNVLIQDNYDFNRFANDATVYRPVYRSMTTYLNATAFNDTGLVSSSSFNPSLLFAGTLVSMANTAPEHFASFVAQRLRAGTTVCLPPTHVRHAVARNLHDVFPSYVMDDIIRRHAPGAPSGSVLDLDPSTTVQVVNFGQLSDSNSFVPTPSQILNNSIRSYAGPAREGTFTVSRLNTVSPSWLVAGNTYPGIEAAGLYNCYAFWRLADGSSHFIPLQANSPLGPRADRTLYDTLWSTDMTWSWTYYQGLSLNSQTSTSMQLLIQKHYTGYEIQPAMESAWSGLVQLGPKPDLDAMQNMMDGFFDLKDCMPAKYNFLGTIASLAGKGLKFIASPAGRSLVKSAVGAIGKKKPKPLTNIERSEAKSSSRGLTPVASVEQSTESLQRDVARLESALARLTTQPKRKLRGDPRRKKTSRSLPPNGRRRNVRIVD